MPLIPSKITAIQIHAFVISLLFGISITQASVSEYKIGVLAFRGHDAAVAQWTETARYLDEEIDDASFHVVPLSLNEISEAVAKDQLDFVLTNTGNYVSLEAKYGISRLSTIKNLRQGKVITQFGAVIFTRKDHPEIKQLSDSIGHSLVAVSAEAFGGFQMAWRELKDIGIDPFSDFRLLHFSGFPQDDIVFSVLNGEYDIGTVRSDVLERLALEGKINLDHVHVLNQQFDQSYPFIHSTRLYPEWPFSKARNTPEDLAQLVTVALLKLDSQSVAAKTASIAGWTIPLDYGSVHELFRELNIGPYKRSDKPNLGEIWAEYKEWILFSVLALLILIYTTIFVSRANRRLASSRLALQEEILQRNKVQIELAAHKDTLETEVSLRTDELASANRSLAHSERSLRKLHDITASAEDDLNIKLNRLLALGCQLLKCDAGFFVKSSTGSRHTVFTYQSSPNSKDPPFDGQLKLFTEHFYAQQTDVNEIYCIHDIATAPEAYALKKTFAKGGSIVAVWVYGLKDTLGVLGFYSVDPLTTPISEVDKDILLLIAQWIGREIERNAAADKLQQRQVQMMKASRLNTLGEMAAGIAHELNQPLTAISNYGHGCIRRMEKSQQIDKELAEAITQIANEAERAGEIMDRLREIVKPGKINRNALNPLECLETALAIIRPTLDLHDVQVNVEKPDQLPYVLADQIQIEQVALNLIRNAMDALIDSNESNRDIDIKLETVLNCEWVKISVSNPGPPIPDDIIDELFNPFISSKEEGMGLGLAISRSIIESHGGEIGLENRDTGTTFFFTLPTDQNEFVSGDFISENDYSDGPPAEFPSLSPEITDERH